ncbi:hypothetical protein FRX31_004149 [Thalictrum thalictroides]|uniref:Uncharacterized protein n=1 Tax=Thalictrum thalictroides TaxID=46969 RepID=A0A7J6X8Z8_THATH|nr:hypothetical protein FRX31_004149 [Thalictrum thalictroides]
MPVSLAVISITEERLTSKNTEAIKLGHSLRQQLKQENSAQSTDAGGLTTATEVETEARTNHPDPKGAGFGSANFSKGGCRVADTAVHLSAKTKIQEHPGIENWGVQPF